MMKALGPLSRRRFLTASASLGIGTIAAPYVARADDPTLRITGWGGKWGDIMKAEIGPAFESEFKCKLQTDSAFPYLPKLQASSRSAPIYDVLHTNSNEQWAAAEMGLVEPKIDPKLVPNLADVYPHAISDKIVASRSSPAPSALDFAPTRATATSPRGRSCGTRNTTASAAATSFPSTASARPS